MIDFLKMRVYDAGEISKIINNPAFHFKQSANRSTGEISEFPMKLKFNQWDLSIKSPQFMEIKGSLHKYWHNGVNNNDFTFSEIKRASENLTRDLQISPNVIFLCNVEFGVNVKPAVNASEILSQIICYKNQPPSKPYDGIPGIGFILFKASNYQVKIYDKGLQCDIGNLLRFEVKSKTSAYLSFSNISTLQDLCISSNLRLLGKRVNYVFRHFSFDDSSINPAALNKLDYKVYQLLRNPREWVMNKRKRNSTIRDRENRFRQIVNQYGAKQYQKQIAELIRTKLLELDR